MTIAWYVVGYYIGYGMDLYERPYGLVPKTWD